MIRQLSFILFLEVQYASFQKRNNPDRKPVRLTLQLEQTKLHQDVDKYQHD